MIELSFVVIEFICWSLTFYVATEEILSQHNSFALYLDHCHEKVEDLGKSFLHNLLQYCRDIKTLCRDKTALSALNST